MIKFISLILFASLTCCLGISTVFSQTNENYKYWSSSDKLSKEDFKMSLNFYPESSSYGQFSFDYSLNGFSFLKKNFNKTVMNYMIMSSSWIDTTKDVNRSLRYQQTLFDISEIYIRKFRKGILENKNSIIKGFEKINTLNDKTTSEMTKRRALYDLETKHGTNNLKQNEWEIIIQKELQELADYKFDK